ncbi:TPA: phage tail protein [Streptococcus suis]|uniref:major tail protein n=1 Tax=Streptococcus suis TaxID=1307 RepID=UPI000C19D5B6|nr:major tail protein [Streptococcus suis]NQM06036.1 phage tail protein [Streptococcus suis]NQN65661.1 phage tail protein [Streptococcus suis]NQN82737.1 phage tail protein [Streptococcus suis]HEM2769953.1 phage tail protein [Streptococcus suis]HEM4276821.1 phage tail protein [Streptococcus suis]
MGKVKFGLSNFEYGVLNEQNKVATTKKLPGMKSAKLELTNELLTIAADDGPYVVISAGITDAKLEIETLDLNSEARKDFYGITVENGVEKYNKNLTPNDIACLFRTRMEDGKSIWVGLLKGKFNVPGMDLATKEGTPDPKTDSTTGSFVARGDDENGDILYIGREDNTDFNLTEFKKLVFPSASGASSTTSTSSGSR